MTRQTIARPVANLKAHSGFRRKLVRGVAGWARSPRLSAHDANEEGTEMVSPCPRNFTLCRCVRPAAQGFTGSGAMLSTRVPRRRGRGRRGMTRSPLRVSSKRTRMPGFTRRERKRTSQLGSRTQPDEVA